MDVDGSENRDGGQEWLMEPRSSQMFGPSHVSASHIQVSCNTLLNLCMHLHLIAMQLVIKFDV